MKFRRFVVWLMISSFLLARIEVFAQSHDQGVACLLYTSPSPRD